MGKSNTKSKRQFKKTRSRKDRRTHDDFWDMRLTPCKTSCVDFSEYSREIGKVS